MDDLNKRFKKMELQLAEQGNMQEPQAQKPQNLYCVMCGVEGHSIHNCVEANFMLGQGICHLDTNN